MRYAARDRRSTSSGTCARDSADAVERSKRVVIAAVEWVVGEKSTVKGDEHVLLKAWR